MSSKREAVLSAIRTLVAGALPTADVRRNLAKPERIPPGGLVVIRDGDPGDPEVTLSPLTYLFTHPVPVEIAAFESATLTREQAIDAMLRAIGAAVVSDRRLGGLCDWIEADAPVGEDVETMGSRAGRFADLVIVAVYATPDPLN